MAIFSNVNLRGLACRAWIIIVWFALANSFSQVNSASAQLVESAATGTTSSTYRKQAVSRIPWQQLKPADTQRVRDVVSNASLYRQLPVTTIQSDPDMYLFLLRYPESIISTWRLMGVSEMTARRVSPFTLQATDGAGTTTNAELIYGRPNLNIYYAEGEYEGPMIFRKVTGKCVIMVESDYRRSANGKVQVTSRMNFFLKIDNIAASIIAKTIHPLVGTTADHNFVETLKFAEKLSETTERNGPGVQRMADRLQGLTPEVRGRFQDMAGIVWQRSQPQTARPSAQGSPAVSAMQTGFNQALRQPTRQQHSPPTYGNRVPPSNPRYQPAQGYRQSPHNMYRGR